VSISAGGLMRGMGAVSISVLVAATACSRILRFGYPAVPRNKRERNVRPAITRASDGSWLDVMCSPGLAPLQDSHDFDLVAGMKRRAGPRAAGHHGSVKGDREPPVTHRLGFFGHERRDGVDV